MCKLQAACVSRNQEPPTEKHKPPEGRLISESCWRLGQVVPGKVSYNSS